MDFEKIATDREALNAQRRQDIADTIRQLLVAADPDGVSLLSAIGAEIDQDNLRDSFNALDIRYTVPTVGDSDRMQCGFAVDREDPVTSTFVIAHRPEGREGDDTVACIALNADAALTMAKLLVHFIASFEVFAHGWRRLEDVSPNTAASLATAYAVSVTEALANPDTGNGPDVSFGPPKGA